MGFADLLWNLSQQDRIEASERAQSASDGSIESLSREVRQLRQESLALRSVVGALLGIVSERLGVPEQEILDLARGHHEQWRSNPSPLDCPDCGKAFNQALKQCVHCGFRASDEGAGE